MKRYYLALPIIFFIMAVTVSFADDYESHVFSSPVIIDEFPEKTFLSEFNLPKSLVIIEKEAFEGTAIFKIELPETVTTIGDRAFANIKELRFIRIPISTKTIAISAFAGSENVTISAELNSYARKYAKTQGLQFVPVAAFCAVNQGSFSVSTTSDYHIAIDTVPTKEQEPERQWCIFKEINVVRILDIIINEIQGRGPPMEKVNC